MIHFFISFCGQFFDCFFLFFNWSLERYFFRRISDCERLEKSLFFEACRCDLLSNVL
jgi:hypothetical protein